MKYVKLGSSGLEVSAITLGCMSYGEPDRGKHEWTMTEEASRPFIKRAIELGITTFDTANTYSDGTSEEILGRALKDFGVNRSETVVATKGFGRMHPGPNGGGLSRKSIFQEAEASLRRLGTDYIDLYQIHRLDFTTPVEETLEALHDLVKSGKVLYLGASSMWSWQFSKLLYTQKMNGWAQFISMQDHYNLINRAEEREMYPLCNDLGIGVFPWSPLARGKLTRDPGETSARDQTDKMSAVMYTQQEESDRAVIAAVKQVAEARGVPRAQIALAWVAKNPVVSSVLAGATKMSHLDDAVASLEIELSAEEIGILEGPYVPHELTGF